jgi:electron transfer flavoprotein beta subunit
LKIVVTVKQVPDPNVPGHLESDNTLARDGEVTLDSGDESGIEIALRIKELGEGEVVLLSMGPAGARDAIRKGLSMGADRGILITDPNLAGADALLTARALAAAVAIEQPDLVVCATESYDGSSGMVPPMLAELLGWPQLTFAKSLEIADQIARVHRQTDTGYQVVEAPMPVVVTVTAAIAEPRYASLRGIMAARNKEVKQFNLTELGVDPTGPVESIDRVELAPPRSPGEIMVENGTAADRIVALLRGAKVV